MKPVHTKKKDRVVYKVVQVVKNRMFSANPNSARRVAERLANLLTQRFVLAYALKTCTRPSRRHTYESNPWLYVLPTRKEARKAKHFYECFSLEKKVRILKGFARNVRSVEQVRTEGSLPQDFVSEVCDSFTPREVVR